MPSPFVAASLRGISLRGISLHRDPTGLQRPVGPEIKTAFQRFYKLYGFGYIRKLELLQEAGFHPLKVV